MTDGTSELQQTDPEQEQWNLQGSERFWAEAIANKAQLCETDIKPQSIRWVDLQGLSKGAANAWKKLWISTFDKSKILSLTSEKNFSQMESVLNLRLIMNMQKLQYEVFDLDNPVVVSLQQITEWDYRHFITRAEGGYEIERQHKATFSQETTNTQVIKDARSNPGQKKRFFGLM